MKLFYLIRMLSIDIILGVVSSYFFGCYLWNTLPVWSVLLALIFAVWFIYLIDHIFDSFILTEKYSLHRIFFKDHMTLILFLLIISLSSGIFIALIWLPEQILISGTILSGFILVYFFVHFLLRVKHQRFLFRSPLIAVSYCIGVVFIPFLPVGAFTVRQITLIISFFILVLSNTFIYRKLELKNVNQKKSGHFNISGQEQYSGFIFSGFFINLVLLVLNASFIDSDAIFILLLVNFVLVLLTFNILSKIKKDLYGFLADSLLVLPGILYFYNG